MRWLLVACFVFAGCPAPQPGQDIPDVVVVDTAPPPAAPPFTLATWNLHNFSSYGEAETRTEAIAREILLLGPDLLAVQELRVKEDTDGSPPQAWDRLLGLLPEYEGLHAPWDTFDTTVGLIYRRDVVTIHGHEVLFPDDSYAFPRPPLRVSLTISRHGVSLTCDVIVLHLKAFGDSADRRRDAMEKLHALLASEAPKPLAILGDLNDDPHDVGAENVFTGTFLDTEPAYVFVTAALPVETVTSTGWYHFVDGEKVYGENLDHVILSGPLYETYTTVDSHVVGVEPSDYRSYEATLSDHFPVVLELR